MAALRWILLLAGLLFLVAMAAWELRRPRQARRDAARRAERSEPDLGNLGAEPAAPPAVRSRAPPPPLVELPPQQPILSTAAQAELPPAEELRQDCEPGEIEPLLVAPPLNGTESVTEQPLPNEPMSALIVDWPPENERHIIALRIVGFADERLSGRALRQALAACGFVHGRFGIFHQPGNDGRALLSAASLSKPGVFDPASMDFNRFAGLSLFAIVPGPLPADAALDHLLDSAHDLAQRLRARVQDEQGLTLDAMRLELLRRAVHEMPTAMRAEPAA